MTYLILFISALSSFTIGMGLGGRGASRVKMINIGGLVTFIILTIQFISSIKIGLVTLALDLFILYGVAYLFNKKYKGLDQINDQIEADDYRKHLENLLRK